MAMGSALTLLQLLSGHLLPFLAAATPPVSHRNGPAASATITTRIPRRAKTGIDSADNFDDHLK
jgi:hypothetical protein